MQNQNNVKNIKKGKKVHIKYENIITLLYIVFAIYQEYYHIQLNGFYSYLVLEVIIHLMFIFGIWYIIKDIRTNPSNWK